MNKALNIDKAPGAIGPYSQAVKSGNTVYVSGQLGLDPEKGAFASDEIKTQTRQSLSNIKAILESEGYTMDDIVKTTVLLKDMGEFGPMNEVYAEFFNEPYPARAAFQVAALPKDGRVEIEAVASKTYRFYGWDSDDVKPIDPKYEKIKNQRHLYDLLSKLWSVDTCAPRMRDEWSSSNNTIGQCSITAFLVQDIFGGKVYGVPSASGGFHCYNVVGNSLFDLTSEQFCGKTLVFAKENEQFREIHFEKKEKEERYKLLKAGLEELLK